MLLPTSLALLALQLGAVAAQKTVTRTVTKYTEACKTLVATSSADGAVPTSTITTTIDNTVVRNYTVTTTPVLTIIPPVVTVVKNKTRTIRSVVKNPGTTSVATVTGKNTTITLIDQIISTVTVNRTSTLTSTLETATSTIYATAGFRPIGLTMNQTYPKAKRDLESEVDITERSLKPANGVRVDLFATAVICTQSVVIRTGATTFVAANATKVRTAHAKTTTSISIATITSVSTKYQQNHTSTTTIHDTYTDTYTTTSTETLNQITTLTAILPTGTVSVYGACGPSRLLGPVLPAKYKEAGNIVDDLLYDASSQMLSTSFAATGYDCCVQCITGDDGCTFGSWDTLERICYLSLDSQGVCGPQKSQSGAYVSQPNGTASAGDPLQVFNGMCGYLYDGGVGA